MFSLKLGVGKTVETSQSKLDFESIQPEKNPTSSLLSNMSVHCLASNRVCNAKAKNTCHERSTIGICYLAQQSLWVCALC